MRFFAFLFLGFLLPAAGHAYSIEANTVEVLSSAQTKRECKEAGHGPLCDRAIAGADTFERETLEACFAFKGNEDDRTARDDDDRAEVERRSPQASARYGKCLAAVKNKTFNAKAVSLCSVMQDFSQHLDCLQAVGDRPFHNDTVDACLMITYASSAKGLECLKAVEGLALTPAKIRACEARPVDKRGACLAQGGKPDLAACQKKLSEVELKIEELRSRSGNRAVKVGVEPVVERLQQPGGLPAQQRDAR